MILKYVGYEKHKCTILNLVKYYSIKQNHENSFYILMQSIKLYIYIYIHFTELHWVAHGKKNPFLKILQKIHQLQIWSKVTKLAADLVSVVKNIF